MDKTHLCTPLACASAVLFFMLAFCNPIQAWQSDEAIAADAVPKWPFEWQVDEFLFHADFDARSNAALMNELQRLRNDISESLGVRINRETVHLILFSRRDNYRQYLKAYFPSLPDRRAMYIKRRGPGMVFAYSNAEMDIDLRHETTHALLNASLAYLPLWLDEGIAEYFEVPAADRLQNNSHLGQCKWRSLLGQVPEISSLEDIGDLADMSAAHYREAWSWVHFLMHESEQSRGVLVRFLEDIQSGFPPGPLSRRVAAEMPDYRARYVKHFRGMR
jgi:hypothetical protein